MIGYALMKKVQNPRWNVSAGAFLRHVLPRATACGSRTPPRKNGSGDRHTGKSADASRHGPVSQVPPKPRTHSQLKGLAQALDQIARIGGADAFGNVLVTAISRLVGRQP